MDIRQTSAPVRCAYCHGALRIKGAICSLCGTQLHVECRAVLDECPTLGCETPLPMAKKKRAKPKTVRRPTSGNSSGPMQELKELYQFMQTNGLESLELNQQGLHVRLVRKGKATVQVPVPVAVAGAAAPPAQGAAPAAGQPALPPNAALIKAPMMGIFYRAASPSSPPFAKEGDTVKVGDVVCLIEAMKVFNDVKAEVSGVVRKVCLQNGKPVKVGQELFILERT